MRPRSLPFVLALSVAAASCSPHTASSTLPSVAQTVRQPQTTGKETLLYRFQGGNDGRGSVAALVDVGGMLYGTTVLGGGTGCGGLGCGTIFEVGESGKGYKILHVFTGGTDADKPPGGLTNVNGTLYGVGGGGGIAACNFGYGCGAVFKISPSGKAYRVVYRFKGGADGSSPDGALTNIGGTLYGGTYGGGGNGCGGFGCGVAFRLDTTGKEHVLYAFKGGTDGQKPASGLVQVGSSIYGVTTGFGGIGQCALPNNCGTIFAINTASGAERVLHRFAGNSDGDSPQIGLTNFNGTLYGVTIFGGSPICQGGCGAVFAVDPSGKNYKMLYDFKTLKDGAFPTTSLVVTNTHLWGTTSGGGGSELCPDDCGTVFAITASGAESVVYAFKGGSDGASPANGLVDVDGTYYGTTYYGGGSSPCQSAYGNACGTVFALKP